VAATFQSNHIRKRSGTELAHMKAEGWLKFKFRAGPRNDIGHLSEGRCWSRLATPKRYRRDMDVAFKASALGRYAWGY
jgi:hypothetical protein